MERKDYLLQKLLKEEKLYLKRIVMTARNKYIKKNSALEFEKTLLNPNLYNIVKTLSLQEKDDYKNSIINREIDEDLQKE